MCRWSILRRDDKWILDFGLRFVLGLDIKEKEFQGVVYSIQPQLVSHSSGKGKRTTLPGMEDYVDVEAVEGDIECEIRKNLSAQTLRHPVLEVRTEVPGGQVFDIPVG